MKIIERDEKRATIDRITKEADAKIQATRLAYLESLKKTGDSRSLS